MIIVASGHPGVDRYCREVNPTGVVVVGSFAEVRQMWSGADKVLVGEHLADFPDLLDWLSRTTQPQLDGEIVLWVGLDFQHVLLSRPIAGLSVWRGEIDREQLNQWWHVPKPHLSPDLDRRWVTVSVFPYRPIAPLVEALTQWSDRQFGLGGGWIDADWHEASLSMIWNPELYRRREFPFEKLRIHRVNGHLLVPAPPPWKPGTRPLVNSDLDRLLQEKWAWQGWNLGSQIATPWAIELLRHISMVVVWGDHMTPVSTMERTEQFIRVYRDDVKWLMVFADGGPHSKDRVPSHWQLWPLTPESKDAVAPARKGLFQMPSRKKD